MADFRGDEDAVNQIDIRVLIIDDDPSAYTFVNHLLGRAFSRIHIDWVNDLEQGRAALLANQHDVYLLDYIMGSGDENGVSLLRQAREAEVDAPLLLMRAYGTYETDVVAMHLGAMDFLDKKSLTTELLERSIRYAIERKRVERELRQLHERVAALEQLKTEMIRVTAHDLKNPVSNILFNLELLRRTVSPDSENRFIRAIDYAAHKLRSIVSHVLSLERLEEIYNSVFQPVELDQVINTVCQECSQRASAKNLSLSLELPDQRVVVNGDSLLLALAANNLLDNAIKYTPVGGRIRVCMRAEGNQAIYEVIDTGPGIPEDKQAKVFRPFFRVEDGANAPEGSGLGLYLVKSIVTRHRGTMIFESSEGQGSIFGFRLPLQIGVTAG